MVCILALALVALGLRREFRDTDESLVACPRCRQPCARQPKPQLVRLEWPAYRIRARSAAEAALPR